MNNISFLEQQLAELRAKTSEFTTNPTPAINIPVIEPIKEVEPVQMITMSVDDLQALIKETIQAEISKNYIPEKEISLDDALEHVLTKEERIYFVTPDVMKKFPNFIVSESGKGIVRQFVDEFLKGNK